MTKKRRLDWQVRPRAKKAKKQTRTTTKWKLIGIDMYTLGPMFVIKHLDTKAEMTVGAENLCHYGISPETLGAYIAVAVSDRYNDRWSVPQGPVSFH